MKKFLYANQLNFFVISNKQKSGFLKRGIVGFSLSIVYLVQIITTKRFHLIYINIRSYPKDDGIRFLFEVKTKCFLILIT